MSLTVLGLSGILVLLGVIFFLRLPVGFAMAMVGFLGFGLSVNFQAALGMLGDETWKVFSSYGFTVIPLFIFMGQICFHAGVNKRLYRAAHAWLGHIRGGIAAASVLACAGFSAICGSNTATAATMSSVALPEMRKYGYDPLLSTGSVAAGATLGVIIPPSVVLIIIGLQTGQMIGTLFWAALGPGVVMTLGLVATVFFFCRRHPEAGPAGRKFSWRERVYSLRGSVEMLLLFVLVMVGLIVGFFTPSQAGAVGSFLALVIALFGRNLSLKAFYLSLGDTLRISAMIMVIIWGAVIFGRFLTVTRLPFAAAQAVGALDVPGWVIMLAIAAIYMLGGAVMDALALLIITIPIFFPLAENLGYSPVWFAVYITLVTSLGAITPPVGINTFVVASMAPDVSLPRVFKGVMLFVPCFVLLILALLIWPDMALLLPGIFK
jgi:tripartite ATP-independent transporter DctM subunit